MSDRLTELQRQRAIIQGHLAWLDQEIAAANGSAPATPQPANQVQPVAPIQTAIPAMTVSQNADEVIAKYDTDAKDAALSARKGCFVLFYVALAIVLLSFFGLYRCSVSRYEKRTPPQAKATPESPAKQ